MIKFKLAQIFFVLFFLSDFQSFLSNYILFTGAAGARSAVFKLFEYISTMVVGPGARFPGFLGDCFPISTITTKNMQN